MFQGDPKIWKGSRERGVRVIGALAELLLGIVIVTAIVVVLLWKGDAK